jgi:5-methylcytosine-specific restriction endonuclease McrA
MQEKSSLTRICEICEIEKPIKSFEHKNKNRPPFYAKKCYSCKNEQTRRRKGIKPRKLPYFCELKNIWVRECKKCGEVKSLDEFPIENNFHSGRCFICRDKYQAEWFQKNFEKIQARNKAKKEKLTPEERLTLAEKQKQWTKKWWENGGKDVIKKLYKTPKYRAYFRDWRRKQPPEKKLAEYRKNRERYRKRDSRRRAALLGCQIIVPYTKPEIIKRDGLLCYLCGNLLTEKQATLEHVQPITRGGNDKPENIKIACKSCNSSKRDKTLAEFKKWRGDYDKYRSQINL